MSNLDLENNFLKRLISSFPAELQRVLGRLNTRTFNDSSSKRILSDFGGHFSWETFLANLAQEFPITRQNNLFFICKLLLFPLNMQRNIFSLILVDAERIPLKYLQELDEKLEKFSENMEKWIKTFHKLLKVKITEQINRNCADKNVIHLGIASEKSKIQFSELCEKLKLQSQQDTSYKISWQVVANVKKIEEKYSEDYEMVDEDSKIIEIMDNDVCTEGEVLAKSVGLPDPPNVPEFFVEEQQEAEADIQRYEPDQGVSNLNDNANLISKLKPLQETLKDCHLMDETILNEGLLMIFNELSSEEMEYALSFLGLSTLKDEKQLGVICQSFLKLDPEPSYQSTGIFARLCILPFLKSLRAAPSRVLLSIVSEFAGKYTSATCDHLLMNLLASSELNIFQVDVICKLVKERLNSISIEKLLYSLLDIKSFSCGRPFCWSEEIVTIILAILDKNANLDKEPIGGKFVECLRSNSDLLAKSLKFAKLVIGIIKKYNSVVVKYKQTFVNILERNETFLKKAGLLALKKIN